MVTWSDLWHTVATRGPGDPKHRGIIHPAFSLLSTLAAWGATVVLSSSSDTRSELSDDARDFWKKIGHFFIVYFSVLLGTRLKAEGVSSFYDMMWACNISMFTTAIGLYKANPEIIGAGIACVSIDQTLWWFDILSYIITR